MTGDIPESIEHKQHIDNLVFEGGGIRGICFAGALKKLDEMGVLPQIKRFAGSSAGAFIALTLAVGYTPSEIQKLLEEVDFKTFQDSGWNRGGRFLSFPKKVYNILFKHGWYKGDTLLCWLRKLVKDKTGNADMTFQEVYEKFGKSLVMTGTNLNKATTVFFNHETTPDMPISLAARISGSLPLVYVPIKYNNDTYLDGGFLNNYPIWVFDKENKFCTNPCGNPNPKTLGLKIIEKDIYQDERLFYGELNTDYFHNYCMSLIECMSYQIEKGHIMEGYWERTVSIEVKDIGVTEFDITLEKKREIINRGYKAVEDYFRSPKYYNQLSYSAKCRKKKSKKKSKKKKSVKEVSKRSSKSKKKESIYHSFEE